MPSPEHKGEASLEETPPFWTQWSDEERLTQVYAARLRMQTDKRLGRKTPDAVKEVARLPLTTTFPEDGR